MGTTAGVEVDVADDDDEESADLVASSSRLFWDPLRLLRNERMEVEPKLHRTSSFLRHLLLCVRIAPPAVDAHKRCIIFHKRYTSGRRTQMMLTYENHFWVSSKVWKEKERF
jgi:hypothetical protein